MRVLEARAVRRGGSSPLLGTILLVAFFFGGNAFATPCSTYQAGLSSLKARSADAKKRLETSFTKPPSAATAYDPSWFYYDFGDFVLPVPVEPKIMREMEDGTTALSWAGQFTAVVGPDTLKEELTRLPKSAGLRTDFDFNRFIYSAGFTACDDIATTTDAEAKLKIAAAKSMAGPFDVAEAFFFESAQAIALAGVRGEATAQLSTSLYVKKSASASTTATLLFWNRAMQEKFHSYLPKIRDKKFFAKAKALKIKPATPPKGN